MTASDDSADDAADTVDTAAAVALLRQLAGRIPDEYLQVFRGYLAALEWDLLANSLTGYLAGERVALTEAERHLLDRVAGPGAAARVLEPDGEPPAYRFTADGPEPADAERWLVGAVSSLRSVRRLVGAYRRPADEAAVPLETWVYLVELDPGADVAHTQSQLRVGNPHRGVVEVYAVGEELPPYHAAALAAARHIWARDSR